MRTRTPGIPTTESDDADGRAFVVALSALRASAGEVAALGGRNIVRGLAELGDDSGELLAKMMVRMDEIEASFRVIRRKLAPGTKASSDGVIDDRS